VNSCVEVECAFEEKSEWARSETTKINSCPDKKPLLLCTSVSISKPVNGATRIDKIEVVMKCQYTHKVVALVQTPETISSLKSVCAFVLLVIEKDDSSKPVAHN
jgi:hypothetical protein